MKKLTALIMLARPAYNRSLLPAKAGLMSIGLLKYWEYRGSCCAIAQGITIVKTATSDKHFILFVLKVC